MNSGKCKTESMAMRDYCLLWGCPGLVILTISLFVSLKVGNDFGQDNFAKFVTFVISSGLQGTVYFLFQSVLADVSIKLQNGQLTQTTLITDGKEVSVPEKATSNVDVEPVEASHECPKGVLLVVEESAREAMEEDTSSDAESDVSSNIAVITEDILPVTEHTEERKPVIAPVEQSYLYAQRCKEFQREQEQRRQDTIAAIMEYVTHTMSPYIYNNEELEKLCEDIRKWADDWQHTPVPIRLKSTLTTLDLRHFVWNIAERLGSKKDYTGEVRAIFIKRTFPDVMKDIELGSIRNFKFQPDAGNIVIDEPDKGDYHFHYE